MKKVYEDDFVSKYTAWRVKLKRSDGLFTTECSVTESNTDLETRGQMRKEKEYLKKIYGKWYDITTYKFTKIVSKINKSSYFTEERIY